MKKTDPTEEERKQKEIEELRRQAEQKRKEEEERKNKLNSLNKQPFDNGRSGIETRTGLDAYDIAELLNKVGYRYGSQRQERARAWEGHEVGRIYFGKDYITIKDGVVTNRDLRKVRACTACDDAMNAINAVLGNYGTDRVRSARADDEPENTEEIDAAYPYGCNQYGEGWKAPHNGRASKQGAPVKKTDKVEEELPKLIGSTKQVEWAESIRENAMWYAEISGDSPERLPLMARIRTAKWWIDHRNDAMTLEQLKEAVAEDEKAFEEELEELERRGERDRSWREYERKVRSGELKPFDPDGKLRRATDYLYSARTDDTSRRRSEPIEMPDGTKCYTEDCKKHEEKTRQTINNNVEYAHDDNSRTGGRSEKERSGGALQRARQASSHSEQGGDKEAGRQHRPRIFDYATTSRSIEESTRGYGFAKETVDEFVIVATAQLQAVEEGRKPAFMEAFPDMMHGLSTILPQGSHLRYVEGEWAQSVYNPDAVRKVLNSNAKDVELDSIVKLKIDSGESGDLLGYGYNLNANPPGNKVVITCNGEAIASFDAPPDMAESEYYASERTEDFRRAFPDMDWSFRIRE